MHLDQRRLQCLEPGHEPELSQTRVAGEHEHIGTRRKLCECPFECGPKIRGEENGVRSFGRRGSRVIYAVLGVVLIVVSLRMRGSRPFHGFNIHEQV